MKKIMNVLVIFALVCSVFMANQQTNIAAAADSMTQNQAIDKVVGLLGKRVYTGQCVGLTQRYYELLGVNSVSGNGADYAWNALPGGWNRIKNAQPQKGDILVYGASYDNPYGHVAIYESDYTTYHQNFNGHQYVEKITNIRYNGFTNPYWGVIRPNFGSSSGVSTSWKMEVTSLTETNAVIKATINADRVLEYTSAGVTVWDNNGNKLGGKTEHIYYNSTYMYAYYNLNEELGITLKPGTTYTANFFVVANGVTYNAPKQVFTTKTSGGSIYPQGVSMNAGSVTLSVGKSFKSVGTVYPSNAISKQVTYSSSNTGVVTVDQVGNAYTVGPGNAYVRATSSNGKVGQTLVKVLPNPSAITIHPGRANVRVGATFKATSTVTPSNAAKNISYTSSTPAVASVDTNGNVRALQAGSTYITVATNNGKSSRFLLTVLPNPTAVSISPKSATVRKGATFKASTKLTPANAVNDITYTSSTPAVASVDASGNVRALHAGYTYISVTTHNGKVSKFLLRVV